MTSDPTSMGFKPASSAVLRRLIMSVTGHEKSGKTDLAMGAPGPVLVINIDEGTEGVVNKFADSKDVWVFDIKRPDMNAKQSEWTPVWNSIKDTLSKCFSYNQGTVVVDSSSEMYAIHRMAAFGKLTQVMPHNYTIVSAEHRSMLREAYQTDMNAIFLHRFKKKYVNDSWDGISYERDGYSATEYDVQLNIETIATPSEVGVGMDFSVKVVDCRQNPNAVGLYPRQMVIPEVDGQPAQRIAAFDFNMMLTTVHGAP
jgi:frataxin-like iron-binding protein CyaY